jgi:hypothetical protein
MMKIFRNEFPSRFSRRKLFRSEAFFVSVIVLVDERVEQFYQMFVLRELNRLESLSERVLEP